MELLNTCVLMTGLGVNSLIDVKIHKVSLKLMGMMFLAGCILRLLQGNFFELSFLYSLLPGVVLLLVSWMTRGEIGAGDGCMIMVLGAFMDFTEVFCAFSIAISMVGVFSLILMLRFHKNRKYEVPFIPFLFFGCFIVKIACGG